MPDPRSCLPGPLEVAVAAGVVVVLAAVTVPDLRDVVTRAQQAEAKAVLREFVAAAKSHALTAGGFACGACGVTVPRGARYAYHWGDAQSLPDGAPGACLRQAHAYQGEGGFLAAAARQQGGVCELMTIDQDSRLQQSRRRLAGGGA